MINYLQKLCRFLFVEIEMVCHTHYYVWVLCCRSFQALFNKLFLVSYTLSEAWSGVNLADLMAAQGAFGADFYERSTRTIVGTMIWTEYRPVIKIGPKGTLGSHEIRPIHSAPSLGQSIVSIMKISIKPRNCGLFIVKTFNT